MAAKSTRPSWQRARRDFRRRGRRGSLAKESTRLLAHVTAARRALGLGAIAAAHTAPSTAPGGSRVASYRTVQTWLGGSDLWPTGADYVPPRPERVPALMDDLVEFCARTDVDPIAQAAIAHAQFLSIQPFHNANGRAARSLHQRCLEAQRAHQGLRGAGFGEHRGRSDAATTLPGAPIARAMRIRWSRFVARHALRAVKEAAAIGGSRGAHAAGVGGSGAAHGVAPPPMP